MRHSGYPYFRGFRVTSCSGIGFLGFRSYVSIRSSVFWFFWTTLLLPYLLDECSAPSKYEADLLGLLHLQTTPPPPPPTHNTVELLATIEAQKEHIHILQLVIRSDFHLNPNRILYRIKTEPSRFKNRFNPKQDFFQKKKNGYRIYVLMYLCLSITFIYNIQYTMSIILIYKYKQYTIQ